MAYTCKACMNMPALHLCAARVKCQPVVFMVGDRMKCLTEWDVKVLSNAVLAQCKLLNKY